MIELDTARLFVKDVTHMIVASQFTQVRYTCLSDEG